MLYDFHCFEQCVYEPNPVSQIDPSLCPYPYDDIAYVQDAQAEIWNEKAYRQNFLDWILEQQHDCSEDEFSELNEIDDVDWYLDATDITISPLPTYRQRLPYCEISWSVSRYWPSSESESEAIVLWEYYSSSDVDISWYANK